MIPLPNWAVCLSLFLLLLTGCRPNGEDLIIHVPAEFRISLREALGPSPRAMEIVLDPIDPPTCHDAQLVAEWETTALEGHLQLQGFQNPTPCLPVTNPERYPFQTPWNIAGSYDFKGTLRDIITVPGLLELYADKMRITLYSSSGFVVDQPETFRLPNDILWGAFTFEYDSVGYAALTGFLGQWQPGYQIYPLGNYGYFELMKTNPLIHLHGNRYQLDFVLGKVDHVSFLSALHAFIVTHHQLSDVKVWAPEGELFP